MSPHLRFLGPLLFAPLVVACSSTETTPSPSSPADTDAGAAAPGTAAEVIVFTTSKGTIEVELDRQSAPKTVENFLGYVDEDHYAGTIFHRVIPGFMIQGGGFDASYAMKPTKAPVTIEADNGKKNLRGTIAMARTGNPNSATCQFFINVADNEALDFKSKTNAGWGYTVFGKVTTGMDVADAIVSVPTQAAGPFQEDVPVETITIESARRKPVP